ncbi:MAG: MCP four helix bundle domain-containing protein [Acidobacteriaceae bacterium]|nr:MCP four helix bundle domain-containing protein [Acidobacteriaceae bacterium]MBV9780386.1 MCP four helix bundle domain-containing protein [Acidobacteriaceae bacterium]
MLRLDLKRLLIVSLGAVQNLNAHDGLSRRRIRVLLWVGFTGLLLLMGIIGLSAVSFLYQIEIRQQQIQQAFVGRERTLEKLRSDIYLSGTYIRDLLLDDNETLVATHRADFLETRRRIRSGMDEYRHFLNRQEKQPFQLFSDELTAYFAVLAPALDWSPQERRARGYSFIREQVLPRRMSMVSLADRIQQVSERELETSSQQVNELFSSFRVKLLAMLLLTVAIGIALASVTLWRVLHLEQESETRFGEVARARGELQQLSAELLSAQESERRRISRELHDEVGQTLWAMMLGLENLRSALPRIDPEEANLQLQSLQEMAERNAAAVRNISLLLRPSMLDDLGLLPALNWLAREISRTTTLQVEVVSGDLSIDLPDDHKTCVYRVVQEAIRNSSRHSGARHVLVTLVRDDRRLHVTIQDDGKGFDPAQEKGIGIVGMEERVVRLGGTLHVDSEWGRGSIVRFELPLPEELNPTPSQPRESAMPRASVTRS